MDVNISVSLFRDQLGTVIEQAVTAAVETVLGEMVKVVGSKFEEFRKEMTAKEKENESIKQMLEISRCQMKTMRKYLSAVGAKDERQAFASQTSKQTEANTTYCPPAGESQSTPCLKRTRSRDEGTVIDSGRAQIPFTENRSACSSEGLVRVVSSWERMPTKVANTQESALTREIEDSIRVTIQGLLREGSTEQLTHVKGMDRHSEEGRDSREVDKGCLRRQDPGCGFAGGTKQNRTSQATPHVETPNSTPPLHLKAATVGPSADRSSEAVWGAPLQAKEEAADIEIICVKEEPEELETYMLNPQCPMAEGSAPDLAGPPDRLHSEMLTAAFTMVSSSTYPEGERSLTGSQRQVRRRQRLKDPNVFEDYKHRRAELKRRSQNRRRELEKSLPQPLLAALVRERREKTRLRVARWRAKRKLQAGLMASEPAPYSCPPMPAAHTQRSDPLLYHQQHGVAVPQYGSLLYGGPHCEGGARYSALQFSSRPLMPGLGHNVTGAVMQAGGTTSSQHGVLGTDAELYQ